MKLNIIFSITFFMGLFLLTSCDEYEDKDTVSPLAASDVEAVRFSRTNPTLQTLRFDALDFDLLVVRDGVSDELSVSVSVLGPNADFFDVPSEVVFPSGVDSIIVGLSATDAAPMDTNLILRLQLDDSFMHPYYSELPYMNVPVYIIPPCDGVELSIDILFDGYGSETTWEIVDEDDEVVASGGPYVDGQETETSVLCMEPGTYTFTVYDDYGDGLSYPNEGSVVLSVGGETIFEAVGDFGPSASTTFTLE